MKIGIILGLLTITLMLIGCGGQEIADDNTTTDTDGGLDTTGNTQQPETGSDYDTNIADVDNMNNDLIDPDLNPEMDGINLEDW